jgi:putative NADPH-quinone reductase
MQVLILDGHPDAGRLVTHLLDRYAAALEGAQVERVALRDLAFSPNLRRGYAEEQPFEPDLARLAGLLNACDHVVVAFPLWWGGEPALVKGFIDRLLLPGFAFRYHRDDPFWDRLMVGRSADLIVTMDTPPWYLRLVYGDPVGRRWRRQILGFCGFHPVRILRLGPTRQGGTAKRLAAWDKRVSYFARSAAGLRRRRKREL